MADHETIEKTGEGHEKVIIFDPKRDHNSWATNRLSWCARNYKSGQFTSFNGISFGGTSENDDWIVDCAEQVHFRALVDQLITSLGG